MGRRTVRTQTRPAARLGRGISTLVLATLVCACTDAGETTTVGAGGGGGGGESCVPPEVGPDGDGACVAAGIPADGCASGFEPDGVGGCVPVLPETPCADGLVALPGERSCRALTTCGDDTWSNIPVEPGTEYVDPSYVGADSDGSVDRPWTDPLLAVAAADDGDIVAFAAGDYGLAPPLLGKRLRLWGRCPQLVTITASGSGDALFINVSGSEVHQMAFTGSGTPLIVADAEGVLIDKVWVHDTGDIGILVSAIVDPTGVVVRDSLLERVAALSLVVLSSTAEIDRTVIRNTVGNAFGPGRGIDVELDAENGTPPNVTITRSLVRGVREAGLACLGGTCALTESAIIDTRPQDDGRYGMGIAVQHTFGDARATVSRSYVGGAHMFGISVVDASLELTESTIDGVALQPSGQDFGDGIVVLHTGAASGASTSIRRSRIALARRAAVANFSGVVALDRVALDCNTIALDGERIDEQPHTFQDLGGNACWCGEIADPCKVLESGLKSPSAL